MLLFYIRHGEPIYDPDSLTPMGVQQAQALAKRLARCGLDKIYSSTSNRAIQTAQPTCALLKMQPELLDFANEVHTWRDFSEQLEDGNRRWIYFDPKFIKLFHEKEVRDLGDRWYDHPGFEKTDCRKGVARIYEEADRFLADLGYAHIRYAGKYKVTKPNDQKIALFAHEGFGLAFLSCLLDIPYPVFCTHFGLSHSGMTVIEFKEYDGYSVPKVLTLSSDAHLYREDLPIRHNSTDIF